MHDGNTTGPRAANEPRILGHDCDGIREYDNPMPFWWGAIFWASIILSVPYFAFYHFGGVGESVVASYEGEVGAFYEMQAAKLGDLKPDDGTILSLSHDEKKMLAGRNMFKANCGACHAPDGGGKTGPNLTDDSYIKVREPKDIFKVVRDGVVSKGMPEWKRRFSEPQLVLLAAYVASLRGTTPASPREPQGERVGPWTEVAGAVADGPGGIERASRGE